MLTCGFAGCGDWKCVLAGCPQSCGVPYVRTVKTSSGATAVQMVYSSRRGSREIEHLGSAHSGAEVELLKAAVRGREEPGTGPGPVVAGAAADPLPTDLRQAIETITGTS